ncbi:MAG: histidine--tRNA ligase [Candidatus Saccharibacteria bacterium]
MISCLVKMARYDAIAAAFAVVSKNSGYGRIEPPLVEDTAVFVRAVGQETDVVSKEMYTFSDRSDKSITLRPEATAGVVRAFIEHGMTSLPQPVKLFYQGPMFRYDRPQAGRQRQFFQYGLEVFGEAAPSIDAQVITLGIRFFRQIGLQNISLQINSIGDEVCRPKYKAALVEYLQGHAKHLGEDDKARLETNPMRILDSKDPKTKAIVEDAPQLLNFLCDDCQKHFAGVLEYLDSLNISYELNPQLVRGLDYYSRTVFEFYGEREGSQASLGGGGRYDALVELLGGPKTPAVGFALGVERVLLELEAAEISVVTPNDKRVYVASLGEPARLAAFGLIEMLLDADIAASGAVDRDGIGSQLERANKLGVKYALIIGQKEVQEGTVLLRDMATGAQEAITIEAIVSELSQRFSA